MVLQWLNMMMQQIDGITIDMSADVSLDNIVDAINAGVAGKSNTVASSLDGYLILSNSNWFNNYN